MHQVNARAMLLASFVGDSLALGAHWIYNPKKIVQKIGRVDRLLAPLPKSQHAGKKAGQFTHYGDQTLVLLRSLAQTGGFDVQDFSKKWRDFWSTSSSYVDQATKKTLANLDQNQDLESAGSKSNELAGAARIAPLIYTYASRLPQLVHAARVQTHMTHQDPMVVDSAEFFARVTVAVLQQRPPVQAIQEASRESYAALPAGKWVQVGLQAADQDSVSALEEMGTTCHIPHAFPGTVQLIARHQDNLQEALIQCVMAGGDSAARGLLVGMVLGATHGLSALPQAWLQALQARQEIEDLLDNLDAS